MPPRRKNEISLQEMEMEEMRRQIQQLQETVNAQQALLQAQQRRFEDDGSSSDSSSFRSSRSHRCQLRMNDIKVDIPEFDGMLQPDEFFAIRRFQCLLYYYWQKDRQVSVFPLFLLH